MATPNPTDRSSFIPFEERCTLQFETIQHPNWITHYFATQNSYSNRKTYNRTADSSQFKMGTTKNIRRHNLKTRGDRDSLLVDPR